MAGYFPNYYGTQGTYINPMPQNNVNTQNGLNTMMSGYQNGLNTMNMNSLPPIAPPPTNQPIVPQLSGKIVDGEDVLKVTEINPGNLGVFPQADLKAVYVKFWNNDGTTRTIKYLPVDLPNSTQSNIPINNIDINEILNKINDINVKLDNVLSIKNVNNTNTNNTVSLAKEKETPQKEVDFSVY